MCYTASMRKWMRERLKRRKKSQDEAAGSETKKAPLQPAYFENEQSVPERPAASSQSLSDIEPFEAPSTGTAETEPTTPTPHAQSSRQETAQSRSADAKRRRRRRGRGGRRRSSATSGRRGVTGPPGVTEPETAHPLQTATESPETDTQAAPEVLPITPEADTPHPSTAAPSARAIKGVVVLAIGLPGSGKSSWFKRHNITPLSSDLLRALLFDDAQEQRFQDLVFSNLRSMLKARLIARRPMNYVDATNLSPHERRSWIKLAKDFGYDVHAVFFDVPLEVCLERNRRRQRVVKDDVMHRMAGKLKPPTFEEGFSKITMVRVKKTG
jgi:predicted kinase